MSNKSPRGKPQSQNDKRERRDLFFILLFFVAFLGLVISLLPNIFHQNSPSDELPVSLHSVREADYRHDHEFLSNPSFNLRLLRDILIDEGVSGNELNHRLATLTAVLLSPVPTATGSLSVPNTPIPASTQTPLPTPVLSQTVAPTPVIPPTPIPTKIVVPPNTPVPPAPALKLTLSLGSYDDHDSSGSLTYNDGLIFKIHLTNTGNATLSNIQVVDVAFGISVTCTGTSLAANAGMLCTTNSPHVVTLAEANSGKVNMTAFATGDYNGKNYSHTTSLNTAISQNPSVSILKSLSSFDDNDSSDTITQGDGLWYQFAVTNTGNVTVSDLSVTDDSFALPVTCPPVSLAPGNSVTCNTTSAHMVTAGEVSAGEVSNTATASVKFNTTRYTGTNTLVIPLSIQLVKSLAAYDDNDASSAISLGDDLWYQFQVTNIGPLALNNIVVTDDTFGISVSCPSTTLASGVSVTCSADSPHTVTLVEANSGNVRNTATVTGQPGTGPVVRDMSTLDTLVVQNAALTIAESANPLTFDAPGQVIDYTFAVSNMGDVTITGPVTIDDDKTTNESCPAGDIDPGNSLTCTASYVVTQADLDAGSVTNNAVATGAGPDGSPVASAPDTVTVLAIQSPAIQILKMMASYGDLDGSNSITLGDELWYRFNVSNSGNVTLDLVSVTDDSFGIPVTCPGTRLAPGAPMLCAADAAHTVTLAEADAGGVNNTASATGELNGMPYNASDTVHTTVSQNPALALALSADISSYDAVGQVITYTYTIKNSGNVTLVGPFTVTDDRQGVLTNCASGPLDPDATTTCTSTHVISQADLDAGSLTNTATVSGNSLTSAPVSLTVTALQSPALTLSKSGLPLTYSAVGQTITYTYTLQNSGNVTISGPFQVNDDKTGIINPCGSGPLSPGSTTSCSASYTTTQYDLDFGSLTNTASGQTVFAGSPVASNSDSVTATAIQSPSYAISKTVTDVGEDGPAGHADQAGDVITYQITLLNTGNVSLIGASASDPLLGVLTGPVESGISDGIIAVGETWTYTGAYTVTQADLEDNGGGDGDLDNTASATTTYLPMPQTASIAVPVDQLPALTLTKSADQTSYDSVGQAITYTYVIENTGNVTMAGPFSVEDDKQGTLTNCAAGPLAPEATTTCTSTYNVMQTDLDAGSITNVATVSGNGVSSAPDSVTINAAQDPGLSLVKTADLGSYDTVGQVVTYTYTIENSGNVTLAGPFTVDDDKQGMLPNCAAGPLAPGATLNCTSTHSITQADLDAGSLANVARVTGDGVTSDPDSVSINALQAPALSLTKTADLGSYDSPGQVITYTYTIGNSGNTTLSGTFTVTDDKQGTLTDCATGPLAPGGTTTCTATHTVAQADIDAGDITNTASVSGNGVTSAADTVTINAIQTPAIQVVKSSAASDVTAAGQAVPYSFAVTNAGNVTLSGITVADPGCDAPPAFQGGDTDSDGQLDLGETWAYSCSRTVTQAEMDAGGSLSNTVSVDSTESTADTDTLDIPITQNPGMTVAKSSTAASLSEPGVVTYNYLVSNTGNITLTGIGLSDDNDNDDLNCPAATLTVGATMNCTATHTFTQTELDAGGNLSNNVTASSNEVPDALDSLDIPIIQTPAIQVVKSSTTTDITAAGQVVPYSFSVTNTGNITLSEITVTDPDCVTPPAYQGGDSDTDTLLDLSEIWVYTCSHTVTQTEVDAGGVLSNTVAAGSAESASDTDILGIPVSQSPSITLTKTGTWNNDGDGIPDAGETIDYAFSVTNSGNVTLTNITLSDPGITLSGGPIATLAVGANVSATITGSYTLTQADIDAGTKDNTATVTGTPPVGADVSNTASDSIALSQNPGIHLEKSLASFDDNDTTWTVTRGDNLWYQFEVTNTGNVTVAGLSVTDDTFAIPVTCPSTTLGPDEAIICTADASHTITLAEANAGQVSNAATASGTFGGISYMDSDTLVTTVYPVGSSIVSGQVRDDSNGNGNLGDKDAGLANVKVELDNGACTLGLTCQAAITDANGIFAFTSVADGSYVLVENDLADYVSTADSDPPNDNQVDVIISGGANSTENIFLDTAQTALCSAPDPVNGFVLSTNPSNETIDVPLSTTTITVTFNQPMITSGAESVLLVGKYEIKNQSNGNQVTIMGVTYDPTTRTATLTIDTSDPDWQGGTLFNLTVKNLKNACGAAQPNVVRSFTTELEISGRVLNSLDSKGIYGVVIELSGTNCGGSCDTATTDWNGNFRFAGFAPGDYSLVETDPAGFTSINDTDPPNDNQIELALTAGSNSTGHTFTDSPATCSAPTVVSTVPANSATGVSLTTASLTVTFSQPMITYGAGSVLAIGNFDNNIDNLSLGGDVPILAVDYDPSTYTATITIDTSDPQWQAGSQFRLRVKSGLENPCGTKIGTDRDFLFTTAAYISGQVTNSLDGKGIYGARVELDDSVCTLGFNCDSAITDLNGDFRFSGYAPGSYALVQTNLPGYSSLSDSVPPNDDHVALTLTAGSNSTGHLFTDTPTCAGGASFIASTSPANAATGVSLSTTILSVTFNQPIITYGGGSVFEVGNFDNNIDNLSLSGDVPILEVSYDPNTYTATLLIDTSDPQWKPGSQLRLRIKDSIKNACDARPTGNVDITFTTDLLISGQVRHDLDGDGSLTDLDPGLSGVTIELLDGICTQGLTCQTEVTNAGGFFTFDNLLPGVYTIVETDMVGYVSTNDSDGTNDNRITVNLAAGTSSIGIRFLDKIGP